MKGENVLTPRQGNGSEWEGSRRRVIKRLTGGLGVLILVSYFGDEGVD